MRKVKMSKKWIVLAPLAVLGMLLFTALGGAVVQALWNWLLPTLFGWRTVTFWQAVGLLVLCRMLFGGFGTGQGRHRSCSRRRLAEHWERMTPEERERLRQIVRERSGSDPASSESRG